MIAVRWGLLLVAVWLSLAALGATAAELPASARRVAVTTVVALLAPLFWPGCGRSRTHTALRIVGWSTAAAVLAAIVLRLGATPAQPAARIAGACAMLLPIVLLSHAATAALEAHWHRSAPAAHAREMAGRAVSAALALLGAVPLWLGPLAELLSVQHEAVVDAVVGASPLTHLAVASGNDLLRTPWLYEHSNLAALHFSYPEPASIAAFYGAAALAAALAALVWRQRPATAAVPIDVHTENSP